MPLARRITLQDAAAALANIFDGPREQSDGYTLAPKLTMREEARDGPDALVVDRLEDTRSGKARALRARLDGDPADRLSARIGQQPGDSPGIHDGFLCGPVAIISEGIISLRSNFQNMHQQPAQAPRGPKSCSKSAQREGVSGLHTTGNGLLMQAASRPGPRRERSCNQDQSAMRRRGPIGVDRRRLAEVHPDPGAVELAHAGSST